MIDCTRVGARLNLNFIKGVEEFVMACVQIEQFTREGIIRCPYHKYKCRRLFDIESIRYHLFKDGFKLDYWVWTKHGEVLPLENQFGVDYVGSSSTRAHVSNEEGGNVT